MLLPNNNNSSEQPWGFFVRPAAHTEDLNDIAHCKIAGICPQDRLGSCAVAKLEPHYMFSKQFTDLGFGYLFLYIKDWTLFPFILHVCFYIFFLFLFSFLFLKVRWYLHKRKACFSEFSGFIFLHYRATMQHETRNPARIVVIKAAWNWGRK